MTENKKKRGRPPGSGKKKAKIIAEAPPTPGNLVVRDPIIAAGMARAPYCASAKQEVPFPDDWDKMGKVAKLQWLTEHRK